MTDKFPAPGQPWEQIKDTPVWVDAVAYERASATAGRQCRLGLHQHTMAEVKDQADRWLNEGNGGSIKQMNAAWDQLVADAAKAGTH